MLSWERRRLFIFKDVVNPLGYSIGQLNMGQRKAGPVWDGDIDNFDPGKYYTGSTDGKGGHDSIRVNIPPMLRSAMALLLESKEHPYEMFNDLLRDAIVKGVAVVLTQTKSEEAEQAFQFYLRVLDTEAHVRKIDAWTKQIKMRKIEAENITTKGRMEQWIADCLDDAQYMEGKAASDMMDLIGRYR